MARVFLCIVLQCMQSTVLQGPRTVHEVLSGNDHIKHPDSSKSPNYSPVTLRSPYLRVCWFLGMKKEFLMGPNVGVYKGELLFFLLGAALCSIVVFTLSCQPELEVPIARQPRASVKHFWALRTEACAAQRQVSLQCVIQSAFILPCPQPQITGNLGYFMLKHIYMTETRQ